MLIAEMIVLEILGGVAIVAGILLGIPFLVGVIEGLLRNAGWRLPKLPGYRDRNIRQCPSCGEPVVVLAGQTVVCPMCGGHVKR